MLAASEPVPSVKTGEALVRVRAVAEAAEANISLVCPWCTLGAPLVQVASAPVPSVETGDALERVRAVAEAAEAALVERAVKSERDLLGTRLLLGLAVAVAVGVPAGIYSGGINMDAVYMDRVSGSVTVCVGPFCFWECHCMLRPILLVGGSLSQ